MASPKVKERILNDLERLDPEQQQRAAELIHGLLRPLPEGASVDDLVELAGTLDDESARQMMEAIEESCERVDDGELRPFKRVALAEECAKLNPEAERTAAERWLNGEAPWPEY